MYTLNQSARIRGSAGEPLPTVWKALEDNDTRLLRGQLSLVVAGPGTGKSAFVLSYALQARVPTLYISADSDPFTQWTRSVSIITGWKLDRSGSAILSGRIPAEVDQKLSEIPIRLVYDASPSLDTIERAMLAYDEVYNAYPHLVVIDNVTNVLPESTEDDLEPLMDYLHVMARQTEAHVAALHHVQGQYNDQDKPIPLSGVKGQITRVPELVLTMHKLDELLCVSTVKNRGAKADPSGRTYAELEFSGDTMQIRDLPRRQS